MTEKKSLWEIPEVRRHVIGLLIGVLVWAVVAPLLLIALYYHTPGPAARSLLYTFFIVGPPLTVLAIYDSIKKIREFKAAHLQKQYPPNPNIKVTINTPTSVQCPYCNTTFQIIPVEKPPFEVKCPNCGKKSTLR